MKERNAPTWKMNLIVGLILGAIIVGVTYFIARANGFDGGAPIAGGAVILVGAALVSLLVRPSERPGQRDHSRRPDRML